MMQISGRMVVLCSRSRRRRRLSMRPHNNSQYLTSNLFRMQTRFDYTRYPAGHERNVNYLPRDGIVHIEMGNA